MSRWIVLLFVASAACSRASEGVEEIPLPSPTPGEFIATGSLSDLQGTWQSSCVDPRENGLGEVVELKVAADAFARRVRVSPKGDCRDHFVRADFVGTLNSRGTLRAGVFALDLATTSARVLPLNAAGASLLNLARACGHDRWKANVERDVFSELGRPGCFERYATEQSNAYTVEGNQLFFGLNAGFTQSSLRPIELERARPYQRKVQRKK